MGMMGDKVGILDHGYICLIDTWGSDEMIIEAARMSTAKGFLGWNDRCGNCGIERHDKGEGRPCIADHSHHFVKGDAHLLSYLWTNKHYTPFEMGGLTIEVQAPIFVFREWHRHRTLSAALDDDIGIDAYNELSARYTPLPDINYIPTVERLMMGGGSNKQAQGMGATLSMMQAEDFQRALATAYANAQTLYEAALASGVPKELARLIIPVGRYSRMRASANLRNWLAFLTLRMDRSAQWEIIQYANAVGQMVADTFPRTWKLFSEGRS